jgi:predicted nuclease with TOPRIM domain
MVETESLKTTILQLEAKCERLSSRLITLCQNNIEMIGYLDRQTIEINRLKAENKELEKKVEDSAKEV